MTENFSPGWKVRPRAHGAVRTDYHITIALIVIAFVTGESWVMPAAREWLPALHSWLASVSSDARLAYCGVIAVLLISLLVGTAGYFTRPKG